MGCCDEPKNKPADSCGHGQGGEGESCHPKGKVDWLLWSSLAIVAIGYTLSLLQPAWLMQSASLLRFSNSSFELMNKMWWGLALAILFVGLLEKVPRDFVMAILGTKVEFKGLLRATLAGIALDLCSHGILVVGMKLYERGASIGQVMAFLIASPWNSLSLTIILVSLIGLKWTLLFILLSVAIAIATGWIFDILVGKGKLPANPNTQALPEDFKFFKEAKLGLARTKFDGAFFKSMFVDGLRDSKMVLRWIFFGVVLAGLMNSFMTADDFQTYFGASAMGLGLTLVIATVLEVCSEGSAPIAAELVNSAKAPGNGFVFLMTGVATDYTEIMSIKETTKSWKISLFLPLLTVPQVMVIGYLLNVA